jgi:LacI family transcriptional regulator
VLASPAQSLRVRGFRRAFAADGLTIPDAAVHVTAEPDFQGGFEAATAALAADPAVTAIFAAYDALTPGVLEAARLAGRTVPRDLSVVGLDDNPEVRRLHPALTTVSVPRRQMAREAAETLLRTIARPDHPAESLRLLEPEMVVRDSSAPPAPAP